uniref:Solute carrier family 35 member B4 n=1 Tax=Latimeria chalumnae TaxID=7897 RepID=H3AW58_LATCH
MRPAFAIGLVFLGCCSNVVFLELLVRDFPGCGNIVTFAQFLFIAVEGFIFQANFGKKSPSIPISHIIIRIVMTYLYVSIFNFFLIFCNGMQPFKLSLFQGSLIANMILGIIILKKRYTPLKYASISMVSLGIFICTYMSAKQVAADTSSAKEDGLFAFLRWLLGIAMLSFALIMSARMGIFQETLYKQYGKYPKEALFYNHCLPLPGFLLLAGDIYNHAVLFSQSVFFFFPKFGGTVQTTFFPPPLLKTRYVCIRGVFTLTTECTSLTVTLVVTLRKFVSLIISIIYFRNPFTAWHWFGMAVVFVGTLMYTEVWNSARGLLHREKRVEKKE